MCKFLEAFSITSRRQFYSSLERRDVRFECRDVDFECLWNVATWISNVATLILSDSVTSRRGFPTSRRRFFKLSGTSRCEISTSRRGFL